MKWFLRTAYLLIALFLVYNIWSGTGRNYVYKCSYKTKLQSFGQNSGKGNIIGLQPWFTPFDFSRASSFYEILDFHFRQAQQAGYMNSKTVVVLPEYVGTWLVVAGEKHSVFTTKEIQPAMRRIVFSNIGRFAVRYFKSGSEDKTRETIFRMKAIRMKNIYEKIFSELAKKYKVTVVAGSIVLPGPNVADGQLRVNKKEKLYNVCCLFKPDGKLQLPLVLKKFPIEEEKLFTAFAQSNNTPVFDTPAGKLGVLICADSWYPQSYENLGDAEAVVVPSYISPAGSWQKNWEGYSGFEKPGDVEPDDVRKISEKEAWEKYALNGRAKQNGIRNGLTVFLRGEFWDLGSDGNPLVYSDTSKFESETQHEGEGLITNLWLQ